MKPRALCFALTLLVVSAGVLSAADLITSDRTITPRDHPATMFSRIGCGTSITQSVDPGVITAPNAVQCGEPALYHYDNGYLRRFHLAFDHGITSAFTVENVRFGIEASRSNFDPTLEQPVEIRLYEIPVGAPFVYANMTLLGAQTLLIPCDGSADQTFRTATVNGTVTHPSNADLVVEIFTPNGSDPAQLFQFWPGTNDLGETGLSYIAAADCSVPDPMSFVALGFPFIHLTMVVEGREGQVPATLFTTGTMAIDRGWPIFGSGASLAEFGQPWDAGPAIPFSVPSSWRVEELEVGLFGPLLVNGDPTPQDVVVQVHTGEATGLPGPAIAGFTIPGVSDIGDYCLPVAGFELPAGEYWLSVLPGGPDTRAAWGHAASTGQVAKSLNGGGTWDQMGSPFSNVDLPSVTIRGTEQPSDILFTTGEIAIDRGWPIFGSDESLAEFGQPWNAGPAIPFSVTNTWVVDELEVGLFGPSLVTGVPETQEVRVDIRRDAGGAPGPTVVAFPVSGVEPLMAYRVQVGGLALAEGNYWLSILPGDPTTRCGAAQSATTGTVAKSVDGGSTWRSLGSPFQNVDEPSVTIRGDEILTDVLFTTGPIDLERGWPVFGASASQLEFGQPWDAGPAVPFRVRNSWIVDELRLGLFGPLPVNGSTDPQTLRVEVRLDDGTGVPGPIVHETMLDGVIETSSYAVPVRGLALREGDYWLSVLPADATTRAAWAQSSSSGRVAKSLNGGATWDQLGSPFADVSVPSITIVGEEVPNDILLTTGPIAIDRGWPIFGPDASLAEFGQPWDAGPAIPFTVPAPGWTVHEMRVGLLGPGPVTGAPAPQAVRVDLRVEDPTGLPLPGPSFHTTFIEGADDIGQYPTPVDVVRLEPGNYWVSVLSLTPETRAGWAQTSQSGMVAKSLNGGGSWDQMGSPFATADVPSITLLGEPIAAGVLFTTGPIAIDRGWPVFGPQSSQIEFGQPWDAGPAVPFEVPGGTEWTVDEIQLGLFGPGIVTGVPHPQELRVVVYDGQSGLPGPPIFEGLVPGVEPIGDYFVSTGGARFFPGRYWIAVQPLAPDTRAAWAQSPSSGTVAKTVNGGLSWTELGSPFADVQQPSVTLVGREAIVTVDENAAASPERLRVGPNPFRASTTFSIAMPDAGAAELMVVSVDGRLVRRLHAGPLAEGTTEVVWDGMNDAGVAVAPGIYYAKLKTGSETTVLRLTLIR